MNKRGLCGMVFNITVWQFLRIKIGIQNNSIAAIDPLWFALKFYFPADGASSVLSRVFLLYFDGNAILNGKLPQFALRNNCRIQLPWLKFYNWRQSQIQSHPVIWTLFTLKRKILFLSISPYWKLSASAHIEFQRT